MTGKRALKSLKGATRPSTSFLNQIKLTSLPTNPALQGVLGACENLNTLNQADIRFEHALLTECTTGPHEITIPVMARIKALESGSGQDGLPAKNMFKPIEREILAIVKRLKKVSPTDADAMHREIEAFWTLLKSCGEPIADLALEINNDSSFRASFAKQGIEEALNEIINSNNNKATKSEIKDWLVIKMRSIQKDLALAHWEVASKDKTNIWGKLNPQQIADYHHQVFEKHNIPYSTFGGTPYSQDVESFLNLPWVRNLFWCNACDD